MLTKKDIKKYLQDDPAWAPDQWDSFEDLSQEEQDELFALYDEVLEEEIDDEDTDKDEDKPKKKRNKFEDEWEELKDDDSDFGDLNSDQDRYY